MNSLIELVLKGNPEITVKELVKIMDENDLVVVIETGSKEAFVKNKLEADESKS